MARRWAIETWAIESLKRSLERAEKLRVLRQAGVACAALALFLSSVLVVEGSRAEEALLLGGVAAVLLTLILIHPWLTKKVISSYDPDWEEESADSQHDMWPR